MVSFPNTVAGINIPTTELIKKALAYVVENNIPSTVNHCIRGALFAIVIRNKLPHLNHVNLEDIILACLMHDLGWTSSPSLISNDKRFEVDSAVAAREFLRAHVKDANQTDGSVNNQEWTEQRLQQIWDAIALHSTPSIALYGQPIVNVVSWGIVADFFGPNTPGGVITVDEYREIVMAYPRNGFWKDMKETMCGLCKRKPETTYDNFVADFGIANDEDYKVAWEKNRTSEAMNAGLKECERYEK